MSEAWNPYTPQLVVWLLAPYIAAFTVALLPVLSLPLTLLCSLTTAGLGGRLVVSEAGLQLLLLQQYGVSLSFDRLAGWFLLLGGLVSLAVSLEARRQAWDRGRQRAVDRLTRRPTPPSNGRRTDEAVHIHVPDG